MRSFKIKIPEAANYKGQELSRPDISKLVQDKAFNMGYGWSAASTYAYMDSDFLYFDTDGKNKRITWSSIKAHGEGYFERQTDYKELMWYDFLDSK